MSLLFFIAVVQVQYYDYNYYIGKHILYVVVHREYVSLCLKRQKKKKEEEEKLVVVAGVIVIGIIIISQHNC